MRRRSGAGHGTARVVAAQYEQGWSLLCNGVVLFDDGGELLPNGRAIARPFLSNPLPRGKGGCNRANR